MSGRTYFSFRYAISGYTFILLVVAINYIPLFRLLKLTEGDAAFGAFLAFLSLFAGSALGFLISQFWYWRFAEHGIFGIRGFENLREFLIQELRIHGLTDEEGDVPLRAILDYLRHREKDIEVSKYAERRWDMYHILSSTGRALQIAYVVGIAFRLYYQFSLFHASLSANIFELLAQLFIIGSVVVLLHVIWEGRDRLMTEYYPVLTAFLRHELHDVGKEDLAAVFHLHFE